MCRHTLYLDAHVLRLILYQLPNMRSTSEASITRNKITAGRGRPNRVYHHPLFATSTVFPVHFPSTPIPPPPRPTKHSSTTNLATSSLETACGFHISTSASYPRGAFVSCAVRSEGESVTVSRFHQTQSGCQSFVECGRFEQEMKNKGRRTSSGTDDDHVRQGERRLRGGRGATKVAQIERREQIVWEDMCRRERSDSPERVRSVEGREMEEMFHPDLVFVGLSLTTPRPHKPIQPHNRESAKPAWSGEREREDVRPQEPNCTDPSTRSEVGRELLPPVRPCSARRPSGPRLRGWRL